MRISEAICALKASRDQIPTLLVLEARAPFRVQWYERTREIINAQFGKVSLEQFERYAKVRPAIGRIATSSSELEDEASRRENDMALTRAFLQAKIEYLEFELVSQKKTTILHWVDKIIDRVAEICAALINRGGRI